jgi:TPR repeat protein
VIKRLGAIGATPDISQARDWYRKAVELGSPAAAQQAAKLTAAAQ